MSLILWILFFFLKSSNYLLCYFWNAGPESHHCRIYISLLFGNIFMNKDCEIGNLGYWFQGQWLCKEIKWVIFHIKRICYSMSHKGIFLKWDVVNLTETMLSCWFSYRTDPSCQNQNWRRWCLYIINVSVFQQLGRVYSSSVTVMMKCLVKSETKNLSRELWFVLAFQRFTTKMSLTSCASQRAHKHTHEHANTDGL